MDQLRHSRSIDADGSRGSARFAFFPLGGFFYQNEVCIARMFQQFFVPVVDAVNQRIYPARAAADEAAFAKAMARGFPPYRSLAKLLLPGLVSAPTKFGFGQTRVNEAIVACALERYRLAQGSFPESLQSLSPRFLQKMPHDIVTGAPLKYRRTSDGRFILYSVGWNEKDDGGQVVQPTEKRGEPDRKPGWELTEGDWVWQYPTPAQATAGTR